MYQPYVKTSERKVKTYAERLKEQQPQTPMGMLRPPWVCLDPHGYVSSPSFQKDGCVLHSADSITHILPPALYAVSDDYENDQNKTP